MQAAVILALAGDLERAWPRLNLADLRRSLPQFTALVAAVVHRYGLAAAAAAVQQYRDARRTAGVPGAFTLIPAAPPALPQVGSAVDWATQPLWSAEPDLDAAKALLEGSAQNLVLDTGRATITDNARRDSHAKGWARITEPGACSFCALLAIRGMVYKQDTANFRAHQPRLLNGKTVGGVCKCHAEPVFTAYEPSAQVREWQRLYKDSTTSGNAARTRREWRRAFDQHQQQ